jgi:hypothetical protein
MRALAEAAYVHVTQPRRLFSSRPAIGIGGAALGGTGKTPLAIAVARHLGSRLRVAIVGHARTSSSAALARPPRANALRHLFGETELAIGEHDFDTTKRELFAERTAYARCAAIRWRVGSRPHGTPPCFPTAIGAETSARTITS